MVISIAVVYTEVIFVWDWLSRDEFSLDCHPVFFVFFPKLLLLAVCAEFGVFFLKRDSIRALTEHSHILHIIICLFMSWACWTLKGVETFQHLFQHQRSSVCWPCWQTFADFKKFTRSLDCRTVCLWGFFGSSLTEDEKGEKEQNSHFPNQHFQHNLFWDLNHVRYK